MTTTFTPGDAVGICGADVRLVAGITLDDPRLPRLWEVLSGAGAGVDAVLDVLLADGFGSMPAFALASTSGTATRVVVRHPAVVVATVAGDAVELSSTPGGTWSDVVVEGASALELRAGAAAASGAVQLPFHAGMTPAAAVRVVLDAGAAPAAAPVEVPDAAEAAAPVDVVPAAVPAPAASDPEPDSEPDSEPDAEPDSEPDEAAPDPGSVEATPLTAIWKGHAADLPADADAAEPAGTDADEAPKEPAAEAPEPEAPAAPPVDEPDDSTVMRPAFTPAPPKAPQVATPPSTPTPPAPPTPAAPAAPPTITPPPASPAPAATPEAPAKKGGLIDGVPWLSANWSAASSATEQPERPAYETPSLPGAVTPVTPPPAPQASTPAPPAPPAPPTPPAPAASTPAPAPDATDDDDDDAPTVLRAELIKELGTAGIVGPSVLAVDCPNGHQTSAHDSVCRLCKTPVSDSQEPRQIPRPPLGALVLANGDRLVLDKEAVLGRAPREPEGATERPHLLRVGDDGDISRQHARILLDGWHVSVRDLGTANGTTLTLPGGQPQQLRANEDYQLEDGAEIGIADVVTLRYEVKP